MLLVWVLLASAGSIAAQTPQGATSACPGDVTLDGGRSSGDLSLLSAHLSGSRVLQGQALTNADVNLDLFVDVSDLARLVQHTSGDWPLLPCGEFQPEPVDCPLLEFESDSAAPLESVGMGTLPEEFGPEAAAMVETEDGEFSVFTGVEQTEEGTAELFVPFYPGESLQGGAVTVQVTDGFVACAPLDLSIQAVPAAPGELGRVLDTLQDLIDSTAESVNLTRQDLLDDRLDLPPVGVPLVLAQKVLDNPDDPENSLRAMTSGSYLGVDVDTELLDATAAHLGLQELVGGGLSLSSGRSAAGGGHPDQAIRGRAPAQFDTASCVASAAGLSSCMEAQRAGRQEVNRLVGEGLKLASMASAGLTQAGADSSTQEKVSGAIAGVLGLVASQQVSVWSAQALAGLLPSTLLSPMTLNVTPARFEEDRVRGTFNSAVTAKSDGWAVDPKELESFADSRPAALIQALGGRDNASEELRQKIVEVIRELGEPRAGDSFLEINPMTFGPVDLPAGEEWKTSKVVSGKSIDLNKEDDSFEAKDLGASQIRVEVRAEKFAGEGASEQAQVKIVPIEMIISPRKATVLPGKMETFTLTVKDSAFPEMIEADADKGEANGASLGGGQHTITYTAPETPGVTDTLTVEHTARTGIRKNSTEMRTAEADITVAALVVTPRGACVERGATEQFSAQVIGFEDQTVTWSATGGDISESGLFKAPQSLGNVVVKATSVAESELEDEVTVRIGRCDCWWTLELGPLSGDNKIESESGDENSFFDTGNEILIRFDTGTRGGLDVSHVPAEQFWGVGGSLGLNELLGSLVGGYSGNSEDTGVTGVLSKNTDTMLEGSVSGQVEVLADADAEPVMQPFFLRFGVTAKPDFSGLFPGCKVE